jgi:hypothetical protein
MPNEDRAVITLEHVLPENPGDNRPDTDPTDAELYFRRVGTRCCRRRAKTPPSETERSPTTGHLSSAYTPTKALGEVAWTIKDIKERQKLLATIAVKT